MASFKQFYSDIVGGINRPINEFFGFGSAEYARDFNSAEAQKQREFSSAEAQKQRDWETEMSNSAHQRAVADMKKAGLNPAMMYGGSGAAASTPSGAAATGNSASSSASGVNNAVGFINSAANLVSAFNSDNNKQNDVDSNSAIKMVATLSKLFG